MKRIVSLILAAAFVLGSFGAGMAADFKTTGEFTFGFEWADNTKFTEDTASDFNALQRVRVQTVIAASENVSGTLFFEIGDTNWGVAGTGNREGGALGTDGVNIETRRAYIDFTVPSTDLAIRMGLQGVALPAAVAGSPVLDDDVAAIVASYAFNDMFSATALWARPFANTEFDTGLKDAANKPVKLDLVDDIDLFAGIVGIKGDGFSVSPYVLFANINGPKGNDKFDGEAYWAGVSAELTMFDPLTFGADIVYSNIDMDFLKETVDGWFLAGKAAYKMDFVTPTFTAWYSTGLDADNNGFDTFFPLSPASFAPTSFGTDGAAGILTGNIIDDYAGFENTWGVALAAEDLTFVNGLSHAVRFAYYGDTLDGKAEDLWGGGEAFEINVDTHYDIYENLAADVQLGWVNVDFDKVDSEEDAWRLGIALTYNF